jgi:hypothetical protein
MLAFHCRYKWWSRMIQATDGFRREADFGARNHPRSERPLWTGLSATDRTGLCEAANGFEVRR